MDDVANPERRISGFSVVHRLYLVAPCIKNSRGRRSRRRRFIRTVEGKEGDEK
jgi:hypothetical protein